MKILISILTSQDALRAKRVFDCLTKFQSEVPLGFEVELKIIVNSLNRTYFSQIDALGLHCEILETKSDGTAATGKNSVYEHFLHNTDCDYCWQIDGDDLIYPWSIAHLNNLMQGKFQFDVVSLPTFDHLVVYWDAPNVIRVFDESKYNIAINTWRWTSCPIFQFCNDQLSPNNSETIVTPDRVWLASRKAIENVRVSEELTIYEDFDLSMQFYFLQHEGKIRYFTTGCNGIYLYDLLRETSVCRDADSNVWATSKAKLLRMARENEIYTKHGRNWNTIPRIMLPNAGWTLEDKRAFVRANWFVSSDECATRQRRA